MQQTTPIANHRIEYFDLLKGIAIFLMVMGHVLTMCIRKIDAAFLFKLIAETHMPIFFFISGYLTYKCTAGSTFATPNIKKRFCQLMIPFFAMSALWVLYFPHSHLLSPLSDNLPDLYRAYWKDGYWFTLCLFEMFIIYYPLSAVLSRLRKFWLQAVVTLLVYAVLVALAVNFADEDANFDPAGFGLLAQFFPIFMIGVFTRKHKDTFQRMCHNQWWLTAAIIVFGSFWYSVVYPWDLPWLPRMCVFATRPIMQFALIIIAIALVEPWSNAEYHQGGKPSVVARYFNYLGHESLGIYLCHYFFLFPLTALQEPMQQLGLANVPLLVVAAGVAFCIVAVTLLVLRVIKLSKPLAFVLLGQPLK